LDRQPPSNHIATAIAAKRGQDRSLHRRGDKPDDEIRVIETARSDKLRRHAEGRRVWGGGIGNAAATLRQWYVEEVVPRLAEVARTEIARAIGVSRVYARDLARGKVPHPRHFEALGQLAGVEMPIVRESGPPALFTRST
jgi:hypothetical protein